MGKTDFCPYEGKNINLHNLAYEIVHPEGWNWQRVKQETVISSKPRIYIMEKPDGRVILLANKQKDGKSGLQYLMDFLASGKDMEENTPQASYEQRLKEMYSVRIGNPYSQPERGGSGGFQAHVPKRLHVVWKDSIPVFLDESDDPVMYALPCCPYCHKRLPIGWETADDFIGIALRGPSGSGKTSYLYTLAHDHAAVFGETRVLKGKRYYISPAYYPDCGMQTETGLFEKQVAAMCRENGQCPPAGEAPPLFLQAVLEDRSAIKRLIIGIYDTPAQIPAKQQSVAQGDILTGELFSRLYADLLMIDPRELRGLKVGKSSLSGGAHFVRCKMLSPDEQAKQQRENKGQVIKAEDLLLARTRTLLVERNEVPGIMDYYRRLLRSRDGQQRDNMRQMRFLGILTKSDLLGKDPGDVRAMLQGKHCLTEEDIRLPEADYGLGAFWYSLSALGCDAFENDHLLGSYAPSQVSEPILSCIQNRMQENEWI